MLAGLYSFNRSNALRQKKRTRPKRTVPDANDPAAIPPAKKPSLTELLDSWEPLSDEDAMPEIKDYPPEPFEIEWP